MILLDSRELYLVCRCAEYSVTARGLVGACIELVKTDCCRISRLWPSDGLDYDCVYPIRPEDSPCSRCFAEGLSGWLNLIGLDMSAQAMLAHQQQGLRQPHLCEATLCRLRSQVVVPISIVGRSRNQRAITLTSATAEQTICVRVRE